MDPPTVNNRTEGTNGDNLPKSVATCLNKMALRGFLMLLRVTNVGFPSSL